MSKPSISAAHVSWDISIDTISYSFNSSNVVSSLKLYDTIMHNL